LWSRILKWHVQKKGKGGQDLEKMTIKLKYADGTVVTMNKGVTLAQAKAYQKRSNSQNKGRDRIIEVKEEIRKKMNRNSNPLKIPSINELMRM